MAVVCLGQDREARRQRERYKRNPEYRAHKIKLAADYRAKEAARDPEFLRLNTVRAAISKTRWQAENHHEVIKQRLQRIEFLEKRLLKLVDERDAILKRRALRRRGIAA
jgi:hypothetical protein